MSLVVESVPADRKIAVILLPLFCLSEGFSLYCLIGLVSVPWLLGLSCILLGPFLIGVIATSRNTRGYQYHFDERQVLVSKRGGIRLRVTYDQISRIVWYNTGAKVLIAESGVRRPVSHILYLGERAAECRHFLHEVAPGISHPEGVLKRRRG